MATPVQNTTGGKTGIFVVPSNNLAAAPVFVTTASDVMLEGSAFALTASGNTVTSENPARLMYTATGSDGKIHMYGLDLTSTTAPAPVQISNLSLTSADQNCEDNVVAEDNLAQPSTMWVVLHVNTTANACGAGGDVYEVINYTDSSSTAPAVISVADAQNFNGVVPMYHSTGLLAGLVVQQNANLDFFASKTFTNPTVMVGSVTTADDLIDTTTNGQDFIGDSVAFYTVANGTNKQLYRVTTAGTATSVYTFAHLNNNAYSADRNDSTNVYFGDADTTSFRFLHVPINSGAAALNYTADATQGTYEILGSNGSLLAFTLSSGSIPTATVTLQTIPATTSTTTATTIGTYNNSTFTNAFLAEATVGTPSSSQIFVDTSDLTSGTKSSLAMAFNGSATQAVLANSQWQFFSAFFSNNLFQIRGITDSGPTALDGGGTFNVYNIPTATATPMKRSGGASYTIPASNIGFLGAIALSTNGDLTAVGGVSGLNSSGLDTALAGDSAAHLIVPISFTNTSITPIG